jgi:hypothetical protein
MQNVGGMRPKIFFFEYGWYMHSSTTLEWDGKKLLFWEAETGAGPPCKSVWEPLEPTLSQWKEFEIGLKKIGFNKWQRRYENEDVVDGFYIEVKITFHQQIICSCYNREPPNFHLFVELLNKLTKFDADDKDLISVAL